MHGQGISRCEGSGGEKIVPTVGNQKQYKMIIDSQRPRQRNEAEELHAAAGVPLGPCGIKHAHQFQAYLNGYQILIYAAHVGNNRVFTGPHKPGKAFKVKCICEMWEYYNVVTI